MPWLSWKTDGMPVATVRIYAKSDGETSMRNAIRGTTTNETIPTAVTATTDNSSAAETGSMLAKPTPPPPLARKRSRVMSRGTVLSSTGRRTPSPDRNSPAIAYSSSARSAADARGGRPPSTASRAHALRGSRQRTPHSGGGERRGLATMKKAAGVEAANAEIPDSQNHDRPPPSSPLRSSPQRISPATSETSGSRRRKPLDIPKLPGFGRKKGSSPPAELETGRTGGIAGGESGIVRGASNSSKELRELDATPITFNHVQALTPLGAPEAGSLRMFLSVPSPAPLLLDPLPVLDGRLGVEVDGKRSLDEEQGECSTTDSGDASQKQRAKGQKSGGSDGVRIKLHTGNVIWPSSADDSDKEREGATEARREGVEIDRFGRWSHANLDQWGSPTRSVESVDPTATEKAEMVAVIARSYMTAAPTESAKTNKWVSPDSALSRRRRGGAECGGGGIWHATTPEEIARETAAISTVGDDKSPAPFVTELFPLPLRASDAAIALDNSSTMDEGEMDSDAGEDFNSPPFPASRPRASERLAAGLRSTSAPRLPIPSASAVDATVRTNDDLNHNPTSARASLRGGQHNKDIRVDERTSDSGHNIAVKRLEYSAPENVTKISACKTAPKTVHISSLLSPLSSSPGGTVTPGCGATQVREITATGAIVEVSRGAIFGKDAGTTRDGGSVRKGDRTTDNRNRAPTAGREASVGGSGTASGASASHGGGTMWRNYCGMTWNRQTMSSSYANSDDSPNREKQRHRRHQQSSLPTVAATGKTSIQMLASCNIRSAAPVAAAGGSGRARNATGAALAVPLRTLVRNTPRASEQGGASMEFSDEMLARCVPLRCAVSGVELMTRVRIFLESERKVFLLTGEAGSGKSLFAALLARDLTADTAAPGGFLPIILDTRESEGLRGAPLDSLLEHFFTRSLGFSEKDVGVVRAKQRLLVIVDGFDRIPPNKRHNMWTTNGWANWCAKVLYTSRPSGLTGLPPPCEAAFVPTDRRGLARHWALETAAVAPLTPDQVGAFLLNVEAENAAVGERLAGLHALGTHPLTLGFAYEVAAAAAAGTAAADGVNPALTTCNFGQADHLTRASVVSAWLEHKMRGGNAATAGSDDPGSLSGILAAEQVAMSMFQACRWTTDAAPEGKYLCKVMVPLRQGLWAFSRSGLLEYLVASHLRRSVVSGDAARSVTADTGTSWIGRVLLGGGRHNNNSSSSSNNSSSSSSSNRNQPAAGPAGGGLVLGFLGEMCTTDRSFLNRLLDIVDASSRPEHNGIVMAMKGGWTDHNDHPPAIEVAAANAMTILCRSGYSFAGRDLSRIRVPGAVMDGGVFDGCSFVGADLTGCSLKNCSLRRCTFSRAWCDGLDVGALPAIRPISGQAWRAGQGGRQRGGGTTIERVQFSPDGAVLALLAADGRSAKVLRTDSFAEICSFSPGAGRLFSPELLEMSPDRAFVIVHTMADPAVNRSATTKGKHLELRRVADGEATLLFETVALPGAPVPAFSPDSTLLVHQNGNNEVGVVDCASGDSVDLIALKLTPDYDDDVGNGGQSNHSGGGSSSGGSSCCCCDGNGCSSEESEQPETGQKTGCFGSGDDEWVSGGEDGRRGSVRVGSDETESPKRHLRRRRRVLLPRVGGGRGGGPRRSSSSTRHAPTMCSLRITPDRSKIQVGVTSDESVILEYMLNDWHRPGLLRVGRETLSGSRVVDGPRGSGASGLVAVLGSNRSVQIRSWRLTNDAKIGSGSLSSGGGGVGPKPAIVEREIARLRCGDYEKIEELAFSPTGECLLTRDPEGGTASIWSIKPCPCLIRTLEGVCCRAGEEAFFLGGKAVALAHHDCTVKMYSCETGVALVTHDVPSPALSVAVVQAADSHPILLAVSGGAIHRWRLPPHVTATGGTAAFGKFYAATIAGPVRTATALPLPTATLPTATLPTASLSSGIPTAKYPLESGVLPPPAPICDGGVKGAGTEGRQLVILAGEGGLVAVDTKRGRLVAEMAGHDGGVSHVAVTPDGRTIVSVGEDNDLIEWDAHTLAPKGRRRLLAEARALAVSPDSALFAVLTFDGAFVYEIGAPPGADELMSFGRGDNGLSGYRSRDDPVQLAFWDSRTLAVALSRGRIQLRDVGQSRRASMTSTVSAMSSGSMSTNVTADWIAHCGPVTCMAARPTGNTYSVGGATTGGRGTTRHRRRSSRSGGSLDLGYRWAASGASASALFANPPTLATGGGDGKVKVWTDEGRAGGGAEGLGGDAVGGGGDCGEGRLRSTGHEGAVLSVCWHPEGEVIASAGQDWAIWLWDAEGRALSCVLSHRRWTRALVFSAAGDVLVSSGKSGFEGWVISVADEKQDAALCWRQPPKLAATLAKLHGAINLAPETAQALRERGAFGEPATTTAGNVIIPATVSPVSGDSPAAATMSAAMVTGALHQSRVVRFDLVEGEGDDGDSNAARAAINVMVRKSVGVKESDTSIDGANQSMDDGTCLIWPHGSDLEARDEEGMTTLALAARHGRGRMVEGVLAAGASVDAEDERGYTPLCWAASGGYSTIVRALLFSGADSDENLFEVDGADPDHTTGKGDTPAILAAAGGHLCALAELEEAGADLDRGNFAGETPLIVASTEGHVAVVAFLAGLVGTDLDRRDAVEGLTALAAAVAHGQTESARVLLTRGADPSIPTSDGRAPVFLAASVGHLPALRLLLGSFGSDRKTEAWRPDAGGRTPIMAASANGHLDCLRALVEVGADCMDVLDPDVREADSVEEVVTAAPAWEGGEPRAAGGAAARAAMGTTVEGRQQSTRGGGNVDGVDNEGRTALMHACLFDQPECVEYLLSNGARLDIGDESEVTPLMLAAAGGHEVCLMVLLDAVADRAYLDFADAQGKNATHYACISGEAGALGLVAGAGACLELPSGRLEAGDAMHPAHLAVVHGCPECLEELAGWNADLEATDGAGETVLSLAIQCGSEACAEFLLLGGGTRGARTGAGVAGELVHSKPLVDPDRPGRGQEPPLYTAARRGRPFLVSLLLQAGADPSAKNRAGETAMHAAARFGQVDVIAVFISQAKHGDDDGNAGYRRGGGGGGQRGDDRLADGGPNRRGSRRLASWWWMTTKTGETATFLAAREGCIGVCRAMGEIGALDASTANNDGVSPVMVAALAGHEELVRTLLCAGGDPNQADTRGRTPAMAAALRGDRDLLECLAKHGACLSSVNSDGRTAAFFAAMNGHVECLAFVIDECDGLDAVATADARDSIGCTPLWTAAAHGHLETVRYLTRRGASPNARDVTGTSAAWMTAGSGNAPCLGALLEAGADGNLANEDGLTPALIAAQGGHANCLRMLAAAGADLGLRDFAGNSAAAFAAMGGHLCCLEVLAAGGADLDVPNSDGHTPVFAAITRSRVDCLRYLSLRGADLRQRDFSAGNTPAMVAASHGQTECLKFIVSVASRRVLLDTNDEGLSCACFAILCGREETLLSLAEMDPSCLAVGVHDPMKRSPVHLAAAEGRVSCLRVMADAAMAATAATTECGPTKSATKSRASGSAAEAGQGGGGEKSREISAVAAGAVATVAGWLRGGRGSQAGGRNCHHPFAGCVDASGESPLHAASRGGYVEAFSYLVAEAGLKPEDRSVRGETCLWLAAAYGRVELLRILVSKGFSVNAVDTRGRSPAHAAAMNNHVTALEVLIDASRRSPPPPSVPPANTLAGGVGGRDIRLLDLEARDVDGATPLHLAVAAGQLAAVDCLIDAGADVNACDDAGQACVWLATVDGKAEMLDLLAFKGASLDVHTQTGATLAHIAAYDGASGCLRVLCDHKHASVDAVNQAGNTPVMFAAMVGDLEIVRLLAERGCDLSRRDIQSVTPAFFAAQEGHTECLALLLSLGADGGVRRADGATPLIISAQNGHERCVALLLDLPSMSSEPHNKRRHDDDDNKNRSSRQNGDRVAAGRHQPLAGLESRTSSGYTALCMAVIAGQRACVELLLAAGAEVDAVDAKGRSPLYLAAAAGDTPLCGILLRHGAKPRRKAPDGVEPSMAAATRGYLLTAELIVKDARLSPESIADVNGVPLSGYLADLGKRRGKDAGGDFAVDDERANGATDAAGRQNGRDGGGKRVAALLPASVARLRVGGKPIASPSAARGIDEGRSSGSVHSRTSSNNHQPPSRIHGRQESHSLPPRPATSNHGNVGKENGSGSGSGPSMRTRPTADEGKATAGNRALRRTWSGVHGGERSAAYQMDTPGRRTPVRAGHRDGEAAAESGKNRGSRAGVTEQQKRQKELESEKEQHAQMSLLDRMTAFLVNIADVERKTPRKQREKEQTSGQRREQAERDNRQPRQHQSQQPIQQRNQPQQLHPLHGKQPREIASI